MVKPWDNLTADDFERIENCGYVPEDHIKLHVAEDNGYRSLFYFHVKMSEEELKNMAAGLLSDESFGNIYRIKGFVPEENTNHKNDKQFDTYVEINATRKQVEINRTDKGQEVIIVIGEGLDNARIEGYIRRYSREKDITAGQSNH
jgi:G3E family GTPase